MLRNQKRLNRQPLFLLRLDVLIVEVLKNRRVYLRLRKRSRKTHPNPAMKNLNLKNDVLVGGKKARGRKSKARRLMKAEAKKGWES
jgi:hypothetical protein